MFALGTQGFIVAAKLGGGGVAGIALLVYYLAGFPIGVTTIVLNIPLLLVGWREIGRPFMVRTAYGVLISSIFLDLFKGIHFVPYGDLLLGALYGGIIQGIGGSIVFRFAGSLGGTDIIAKILNRRRGYTIGNVSLATNAVVIGLSLFILGSRVTMYTLVALYVSTKVIDAVLAGIPAKAAMIISERGDDIAEAIITEVQRGVTVLRGQGGYTQGEKELLLCVVSLTELVAIKRLVKEMDPTAFVIVNDTKEVLGKGFTPIGKQ